VAVYAFSLHFIEKLLDFMEFIAIKQKTCLSSLITGYVIWLISYTQLYINFNSHSHSVDTAASYSLVLILVITV